MVEVILYSGLDMECACVYVCVRERDSRDTRSGDTENRIRKLMYFTKETDSTTYKVGGGCFI